MRQVRIFVNQPLAAGDTVVLDEKASHYLRHVLRLNAGDRIHVFNGAGGCFAAEIVSAARSATTILPREFLAEERESPLEVTLVQGLARGQKMDYVMQKAVELGVDRIVPVATEHSQLRLTAVRAEKRLSHWRGVVTSACEQCGRNRLPVLEPPMPLAEWTRCDPNRTKLILHPLEESRSLADISPENNSLTLLAGPEGGLSDRDVEHARAAGYLPVRLGPRVLRTETAAVAAMAICQNLWGDVR